MNKLMEERESVCVCVYARAHVCVYVCGRERDIREKEDLRDTMFSCFFFFGSTGGQRSQGSPKMPCPTAHPNKLQVTTANRFTKHTDLHYNVTHWGPLTTENCTLLSARRPAQPQAWCCPHSHHKFLKIITPLTFLLSFLPRLFTTPIFHIIYSRQHQLHTFIRAQIHVSAQPPPSMLVPPLFLFDQPPVFSKISPPICYVPKSPSNDTFSLKH